MTDEELEKLRKKYGESEKGNFQIRDIIIVPHPFMIGSNLVAFTANNHMGLLGEEAIIDAEKHGIGCEWREDGGVCNRTYVQHEKSLLIECKLPYAKGDKMHEELWDWLKPIKDKMEKDDGVKGFGFCDKNGKGAKRV